MKRPSAHRNLITFVLFISMLSLTIYAATQLTNVHFAGFESGEQGWIDPGSDSRRLAEGSSGSPNSQCDDNQDCSGVGGFNWHIQDDSSSSHTEQSFDFTGNETVNLSFWSWEDDWENNEYVRVLCDSTEIWRLTEGEQNENEWIPFSIQIHQANCTFDSAVTIRFDGAPGLSNNGDEWYIDGINITSYATITIDTTAPSYTNLTATPANNSNYSLTHYYEFNITLTENTTIDEVLITFNNTNYSLTAEEITNLTNIYTFNRTGLAAATYTYIWIINDTSSNVNQTTTQSYTIQKSEAELNLTLANNATNLTTALNEVVNITATRLTGEGLLTFYQNGNLINQGTTTISNETNYTAAGTYNITVHHGTTENYTTAFVTYYVTTINTTIVTEDNSTPTVMLISPINGSTSTTRNITFESNATDNIQLHNATLYHNISGSWQANQTINVTGTFSTANFTLTNLNNTNFKWNILYCDNSSNCAFATNNYTLNISLTAGSSGGGSSGGSSSGGGSGTGSSSEGTGSSTRSQRNNPGAESPSQSLPSSPAAPSSSPKTIGSTGAVKTIGGGTPAITGAATGTFTQTLKQNFPWILLGLLILIAALSYFVKKNQHSFRQTTRRKGGALQFSIRGKPTFIQTTTQQIQQAIKSYVLHQKRKKKQKSQHLNTRRITKKVTVKEPNKLHKLEGLISEEFMEKITGKQEEKTKVISHQDLKTQFPETFKELLHKGIHKEQLKQTHGKSKVGETRRAIKRERKVITYSELQKKFPETLGKTRSQPEKSVILDKPIKKVEERVTQPKKNPLQEAYTLKPTETIEETAKKTGVQANRKIKKQRNKQQLLKKLEEVYDIE